MSNRYLSFICKYSDREILSKIKKILGTKNDVHDYPEYKSPQSRLNVCDRPDISMKYTKIKSEVPIEDIKGFERHFIRGLFDGDGTLSTRKNRGTFRIGFIDEKENITQWVSDTITNALKLDYKKCRWVPQNNVYEVLWEGNIANLIAFWLYHGDIENCCLQRKLEKYKSDVLNNKTFDSLDEEMLYAAKAYINQENEVAFNVPGLQTLKWCHRVQNLLSYNTTPVFHNKGRRKYYHLHIPQKIVTNTQSAC